jgi:hypothetical protein
MNHERFRKNTVLEKINAKQNAKVDLKNHKVRNS